MDVLPNFSYRLVFSLEDSAYGQTIKNWSRFKKVCESGNNNHITGQIKENCELVSNKNLPILNRAEGGLGGDDNKTNKQIRFRHNMTCNMSLPSYITPDNLIVLDEIISTQTETWTFDELRDILKSFIKTANWHLDEECVKGHIEMTPYN
jgi:hypothetical protein